MEENIKGKKLIFRHLRVLVAEDDEQGAKLINMVLTKMGFGEIIHAKNGKAAWDILTKPTEKFGLIISDWNMPEMTGIELLENVRGRGVKIPFVMITGRGTMDSAVEAKTMGVTSYISKPYTPQQLIQKIAMILET